MVNDDSNSLDDKSSPMDISENEGFQNNNNENLESSQEDSNKYELHLFDSNLNNLEKLAIEYPELKLLIAIRQPINSLMGIENFKYLKELWIIEAELTSIQNLTKASKTLKRIFLYTNKINKLPNISNLHYLTKLWLAENKLTSIENIKYLKSLEDLNLASNQILKIGLTFKNLTNLKKLNLANNPLYSFSDIKNLKYNVNLNELVLADFMYGFCPVSQLCYYRAYVINQLNNINQLDNFQISNEERENIQEFVNDKKVSYNILYRNYVNEYFKKINEIIQRDHEMLINFRKNFNIYRLIAIHLNNLKKEEYEEILKQNYELKFNHLKLSFKKWKNESNINKIKTQSNLKLSEIKLCLELESWGNITLYTSEDKEFLKDMQSLMNKFTCSKMKKKGITGVQVLGLTRVLNKPLNILSHWYIQQEDNQGDWSWCILHDVFDTNSLDHYPVNIIKFGFQKDKKNVTLGNCLADADEVFLSQIEQAQFKGLTNFENSRTCLLLHCSEDALIYKIVDNICNQDKQHVCRSASIKKENLIIPLCLINFEYIFENRLEDFRNSMGWKCNLHDDNNDPPECLPKIDCLNMITIMKLKKFHDDPLDLSGYQINYIGDLLKLNAITTLNLSHNSITCVDPLFVLCSLKSLDLSFNIIKKWSKKIKMFQLEYLNLSWNLIQRMYDLILILKSTTPHLNILDIRYNPGVDINHDRRNAAIVNKWLSSVDHFNGLSMQVWFQKDSLPEIDFFGSKHDILNKQIEDIRASKKNNPLTIWNLDPNTWEEQYQKFGRKKEQISNRIFTSNIWVALNESNEVHNSTNRSFLNLNGLQIIGLSHTKKGGMLKRLHAAQNLITNLNFLARMPLLEELNLRNNVLYSLGENSFRIQECLVSLDLSCNYLSNISSLETSNMRSLKVLDISSNLLETLNGLSTFESLEELYAAENRIKKIDSASMISSLEYLRILDLTGNRIQKFEKYRAYFVFNFKSLEYLDGLAIDENELRISAHTFGQVLNQKILPKLIKIKDFHQITNLSLVNCSIRKISLDKRDLPNITYLDLSHNELCFISGLDIMPKLETLLLSHNQISQISCKMPPMIRLENLFLDNNNINTMNSLHLGVIAPELRSLFIFENNISEMSGLNGLTKLKYLIMDRNKIVSATKDDFTFVPSLMELYLTGNRLHFLYFLKSLTNLEKLFLCKNRIADKDQLRHLNNLKRLKELSLYGNPIVQLNKKHYIMLLEMVPWIKKIDGYKLTDSGPCSLINEEKNLKS